MSGTNPTTAPIKLAPPAPGIEPTHLSIIATHDGMIGKFRNKCPSNPEQIPDWIGKLRNAFLTAGSGVVWHNSHTIPGDTPKTVLISCVCRFTLVFDTEIDKDCRITVLPVEENATHIRVTPPQEILDQLSSGVYSAIYQLIDWEDRMFYEGVPDGDGWALLKRLRTVESHDGDYVSILENRRSKLKCTSLKSFSAFKASVLQLKSDWDKAVQSRRIEKN